jgi:hypothetical protein
MEGTTRRSVPVSSHFPEASGSGSPLDTTITIIDTDGRRIATLVWVYDSNARQRAAYTRKYKYCCPESKYQCPPLCGWSHFQRSSKTYTRTIPLSPLFISLTGSQQDSRFYYHIMNIIPGPPTISAPFWSKQDSNLSTKPHCGPQSETARWVP